ncbi:hypothetical protein C8F04DRAFT_1060325 [Mycena alexandri]|uniref:Uncharacterized protein n=1 Tax=Mycena alexandri TaxID=1745969 RepID=A0AAD6TJN7_9AGAR|nr:hypothetical protein C8F04DRAFT_1060325 [Mycena alexandri]
MPNPSSTSHKRPFQDITDRFISSPRPKRKPKIPSGALGEKLRLRVIETTKPFPSSLPPSSPPLYSSSSNGLPLLNSEDEVVQEVHDEPFFGRDDFGSMLPSDENVDDDAENRPPENLSDPFGFFAVERKLKAEREVIPIAAQRASRFTDDKGRDDGLVMPSTPHKPTLGKRRLSATADVLSPVATSLGSPSPVKGVGTRHLNEESDMNTSHEILPVRPQERDIDDDHAPPRSKRARQSSETSLPPRRSTRGQSKPTAKEKKREVARPKKRVGTGPAKAKIGAKSKGKGKKKVVEDNDSDDDPQEKFEAERLARLEYFRKLDDYSFEKENVYVV